MRTIIASLLCLAAVVAADAQERARATFAGGCFWCMEPPFDKLDGVVSTTSGYTGGRTTDPTYEQVSAGGTGQRRLAEESRRAVAERLRKPVVTEVVTASKFWPAEDYHQDYYKKNPIRYNLYRAGCGRDQRLEAIWGPAAKDRARAR
jgi:peptide-methionine (S)-S-oxide reductase